MPMVREKEKGFACVDHKAVRPKDLAEEFTEFSTEVNIRIGKCSK